MRRSRETPPGPATLGQSAPDYAAQAVGGTERQLQAILAEGLREMYFRDRGRRAHGLEVEFTDIEGLEIEL